MIANGSNGMITIIVPTYNRNGDLENCLSSISKNTKNRWEAIVLTPEIDNELSEICTKFSSRCVLDKSRINGNRKKSLWAIINLGIELAVSEYVVWLNDDCLVLPGWDEKALGYFSDDVGLVVLKTRGINNNPEFRVMDSQFGLPCANYGVIRKSLGVRFDEGYSWFYGDADISIEMLYKAHKLVVASEEGLVIHNHRQDATRKDNESNPVVIDDINRYVRKWKYYRRVGNNIIRKPICNIILSVIMETASSIKKKLVKLGNRTEVQ